jgi:hypothetical protein
MPLKCETPHDGGASRKRCGGCFRDPSTPRVLQTQFLIGACQVRPELAAMLAAFVFGGGTA